MNRKARKRSIHKEEIPPCFRKKLQTDRKKFSSPSDRVYPFSPGNRFEIRTNYYRKTLNFVNFTIKILLEIIGIFLKSGASNPSFTLILREEVFDRVRLLICQGRLKGGAGALHNFISQVLRWSISLNNFSSNVWISSNFICWYVWWRLAMNVFVSPRAVNRAQYARSQPAYVSDYYSPVGYHLFLMSVDLTHRYSDSL